jgi:hypothetical protein
MMTGAELSHRAKLTANVEGRGTRPPPQRGCNLLFQTCQRLKESQ